MTLHESDQRPEDLIQAYLDGSLAPEEAETLLTLLRDDPDLVGYLIEGLRTDILIQGTIRAVEEEVISGNADRSHMGADGLEPGHEIIDALNHPTRPIDENEVRRIKEYAEHQLERFLAEQEQQRRLESFKTRKPWFTLDMRSVALRVNRLMAIASRVVVASALCVAATMVILVSIHYVLSQRVVATLGETTDAQWSTDVSTPELKPGRMILRQGFAQLVFKRGAEVILQAPAAFQLQSANGLFLENGRITAKVPEKAKGFTVETTRARVIDYGTEFGIMAGAENSAEVHVFNGQVGLMSMNQVGTTPSQRLKRGEAATVDKTGHIVRSVLANRPALFIREIPRAGGFAIPGKRLNLADIVGGGDGLDTGTIGQGINPLTGASGQARLVLQARGNGFVRTPALPFIDGVFVPGSGPSPMVISSTGIVCQKGLEASGFCYEGILNGALFQHVPSNIHQGRLAGITYGTREHPSIGLHANAGITFDLDKIRSAMPEVEITGFRSLCGVSETVAEYSDGIWESKRITVTFWILTDGKVRSSRELTIVPSESEWMEVPIEPADHFLTLMTTSPEPSSAFCWSMVADPTLELTGKIKE